MWQTLQGIKPMEMCSLLSLRRRRGHLLSSSSSTQSKQRVYGGHQPQKIIPCHIWKKKPSNLSQTQCHTFGLTLDPKQSTCGSTNMTVICGCHISKFHHTPPYLTNETVISGCHKWSLQLSHVKLGIDVANFEFCTSSTRHVCSIISRRQFLNTIQDEAVTYELKVRKRSHMWAGFYSR